MSPIIRELVERELSHVVIHTGQHYSFEMDRQFFQDLRLPEPAFRLDAGRDGMRHGEQTAAMLVGTEQAMLEAEPDLVLVGGDANTNLSGALAARKLHLTLGHNEAGLRSFDWRMPEEHNRVMIDHISDFLFAPTPEARGNLFAERIRGRILVVGNTGVDALQQNFALAEATSKSLERLGLSARTFALMTIHREENVDEPERLAMVVEALQVLASELSMPVVFPVHPRTNIRLRQYGLLGLLDHHESLLRVEPLGYVDFLRLLGSAAVVLTDSGGIQEEACVLGVPCVTLRDSTERPESVAVGANRVAGLEANTVAALTVEALKASRGWPNPFGDGRAAQRIVDSLLGMDVEEYRRKEFELPPVG